MVLVGVGVRWVGRLLLHAALALRWFAGPVRMDPDCPVCGESPTVTSLVDYEAFCGVPASGEATVPTVSAPELAVELGSDAPPLLVDVRGPDERAIASIPGAVAIHLDEFRDGSAFERDELAARGRRIVMMCKVGGRSAEATTLAQAAGYTQVLTLEGGVLAWVHEVDPTQPTY